jgi:uncharacterized protein with von Willebrand factor type A (vWA) domain
MHNDQLEKLYDELYEKFLDQEEELAEVQARADSYMGTLGRTKDENSRLRALAEKWEKQANEMQAQAGLEMVRTNAAEALNRELVEALDSAEIALKHSRPHLDHYPEPVIRHENALKAVHAALAKARKEG